MNAGLRQGKTTDYTDYTDECRPPTGIVADYTDATFGRNDGLRFSDGWLFRGSRKMGEQNSLLKRPNFAPCLPIVY